MVATSNPKAKNCVQWRLQKEMRGMKGVVLSAGLGSRFGSYTKEEHKLLMMVNGRPIIDYTLRSFYMAGIVDVVLVVGFMADRIRDWVGDGSTYGLHVQYAFNPDYKLGNALSLREAHPFIDDEVFILSMGDHMISSKLINNVMGFYPNYEASILGVDFNPSLRYAQDVTRVMVEAEERISSIGKHIEKWNGTDSGVFRLNPEIFEIVDQWINLDKSERYELGDVFAYMISQGGVLKSCDISDCYWYDVDTLEDLQNLQTRFIHPDE
jgi:choline kinase